MIHIVGAGPGDPELITVKGARYLSEADVVIYAGSLVNPALLEMCKEGVEIHNSAHMTLDDVVEVIVRAESEGKMTVRLHTGDPAIYGAIQEQMDGLRAAGVAEEQMEVVPGVVGVGARGLAARQRARVGWGDRRRRRSRGSRRPPTPSRPRP